MSFDLPRAFAGVDYPVLQAKAATTAPPKLDVAAILNQRPGWSEPRFPVNDYSVTEAVYEYGDLSALDKQVAEDEQATRSNPALAFLKEQHAQGNTGKGVVFFIDEAPSTHRLSVVTAARTLLPGATFRLIDSEAGGNQVRGSRRDELSRELKHDVGPLAHANLQQRTVAQILAYLDDKIEVLQAAAREGARYVSSSSVVTYGMLQPSDRSDNRQVNGEFAKVMQQKKAVTEDQRTEAWADYVRELAASDPQVQAKIGTFTKLLQTHGIVYAEGAGNFADKAVDRRFQPPGAQGTLLSELVPQVMTVGATDPRTGAAASYSSRNAGIDLREEPAFALGTSLSTPSALAQVVLLVGAGQALGRELTPQAAVTLLKASADATRNTESLKDGVGDLRFEAALARLRAQGGSKVPTSQSPSLHLLPRG